MDTSSPQAPGETEPRPFNGAMTFQPWIPGTVRAIVEQVGVPSMEP